MLRFLNMGIHTKCDSEALCTLPELCGGRNSIYGGLCGAELFGKTSGTFCLSPWPVFAQQFATIDGSPNVILIGDVKETGDQRYENLLRNEHRSNIDERCLIRHLRETETSDSLILAGGFDLATVVEIVRSVGPEIHVDLGSCRRRSRTLRASSQAN